MAPDLAMRGFMSMSSAATACKHSAQFVALALFKTFFLSQNERNCCLSCLWVWLWGTPKTQDAMESKFRYEQARWSMVLAFGLIHSQLETLIHNPRLFSWSRFVVQASSIWLLHQVLAADKLSAMGSIALKPDDTSLVSLAWHGNLLTVPYCIICAHHNAFKLLGEAWVVPMHDIPAAQCRTHSNMGLSHAMHGRSCTCPSG